MPRNRRKLGPVKITYADGTVEVMKASKFKYKPQEKVSTPKQAIHTKHWKALRRKALRRDDYCCTRCFVHRDNARLEVHHLTYERAGHELLTDVVTLCQPCHSAIHAWQRREAQAAA